MGKEMPAHFPSSPRTRGSSDFMRVEARALDSRLRGNDEQRHKPTPTRLGDVAEVFVGYPFRSETFAAEGVKLLRGDNISQGHIDWTDAEKLSFELASDFPAFELGEGDIVLAMDRPWVSAGLKFASVREQDAGALLVQRTARLRGIGDTKTEFLRYVIASPAFTKYIKGVTTGSLVPHISKKQIQDFRFFLPVASTQQKIAAVLSVLDAKIDLNNRINAELEALAKTIYDYWFVQFDFPDANGRPYKSSGGAMVWNDTLKREIPADWEDKCLAELGSFRNGINYDPSVGGSSNAHIVNVRNVSGSSIFVKYDDLDSLALAQTEIDKYLVRPESILIARSGIPGATRMMSPCPPNTIYCGFIICFSVSDLDNKLVVFFRLKQLEVALLSNSSGSILKNVSQDTLKAIRMAIPSNPSAAVITRFNNAIEPLYQKINLNDLESAELTQLRDWLLPLLMNGQVRVAGDAS